MDQKREFFIVRMRPWRLLAGIVLFFRCADKGALEAPLGYPSLTICKIAVACKLEKLVDTQPSLPDSLECFPDLVYRTAGSCTLRLDLYRLKGSRVRSPVLVFIHGGAWKSGDKRDYRVYLVPFAAKGYVTISVAYRLSREAPFPAAVQDILCAVTWIQNHAEGYGMDANRISLIGGSAGGHLAMMAAYAMEAPLLQSECNGDSAKHKVRAVVCIYGPSDLTTPAARENSAVVKFLGKTWDQAPDLYAQASPLFWIDGQDPATLLFHGTLDELVPVAQSDSLAARLQQAHVPVVYHRLRGWPHTMDLAQRVNDYCFYHMNEFFIKYL
ncbi:MAG TPA: alpha/beta hydrolase [bacterium]|nr:alpha/beta hydrolase [bacterium]HPN35912.1 alpha/beta hydrolase [bacterium]